MTRPIQRAGHIGDRDNRFCGHGVFTELHAAIRDPFELVALAFGVRLAEGDREVVRCMALALCSPDARVWPLKLARTLAAYGNPIAGSFGAQLASDSDRMGPGTAAGAAASLVWLAEELAAAGVDASTDDATLDAALAAAVERHRACRGRIMGFGVPFRAEDERLLALREMLAGHPATRRPTWRLFERLARVMRGHGGLAPNIVIALAALLVDSRARAPPGRDVLRDDHGAELLRPRPRRRRPRSRPLDRAAVRGPGLPGPGAAPVARRRRPLRRRQRRPGPARRSLAW
jgi:hypothetical protein